MKPHAIAAFEHAEPLGVDAATASALLQATNRLAEAEPLTWRSLAIDKTLAAQID